jgi:asparagine N-glycosylation enzyme membrane subunit Stt3
MDRYSEWFVPKFGPRNFRLCCGILFLPYTGMVVSFAAWGSFATIFSIEKLVAICVLYFLALGVSAHCLDALGSKNKPWGVLSKKRILIVSLSSLSMACTIGLYYAFLDSPLLIPIGIAETFFLFAYNLELFKGKFHNNTVFVISWGILPVFAGSAIQTNTISFTALILSGMAAALSFVLIKTSRKYKRRVQEPHLRQDVLREEIILKLVSIGVIASTISYLVLRYA